MGIAIDHLVSLGHRRIKFLRGFEVSGSAMLREEGYYRTMVRHELTPLYSHERCNFFDDAQAEAQTRGLFSSGEPDRPTALLCLSDLMAMVVCRTLRSMGLVVPDQVSVVGFDDIPSAARFDPPLTTMGQPFQEMGRQAVRHLLSAIDQGDAWDRHQRVETLMPAQLIVRQSTAPML
jgi:DNA-binding LacI/PurR family transcriptional regulator